MRFFSFILGCAVFGSAHGSHLPEDMPEEDDVHAYAANPRAELTMRAIDLIGIRYRYGGDSPASGFDCSGFVRYVFKDVWDTRLPRSSAEISLVGRKIRPADLEPGDLVFYNTLRRPYSHVGIYIGENRFIHAPASGGRVRIESMDLDYWKKRFNGARRLQEPVDDATRSLENDVMTRTGNHGTVYVYLHAR